MKKFFVFMISFYFNILFCQNSEFEIKGKIEHPLFGCYIPFSGLDFFTDNPYKFDGRDYYFDWTIYSFNITAYQHEKILLSVNLMDDTYFFADNPFTSHQVFYRFGYGLTCEYLLSNSFNLFCGLKSYYMEKIINGLDLSVGFRYLPFKTEKNEENNFFRFGFELIIERYIIPSDWQPTLLRFGIYWLNSSE